MGVTYERFMESTPKMLEPFYEAYRKKMETIDSISYRIGLYVLNATTVAIDHCLNGRKAKSEYIKEPIGWFEKELTEKEKIEQTKNLFKQLEIAKTNFELSKEIDKGEKDGGNRGNKN